MSADSYRLSNKSVDQIVSEIKDEVAERRANGDYPIGLEQQLEAFFDGMMRDLHERDLVSKGLGETIERLAQVIGSISVDVASQSRVPGMSLFHRVFGKFARRHTQHLANQLTQLGDAALSGLREVSDIVSRIYEHDDREIARVLSAVQDQLAVVEHLSHLTVDLEARLRTLEANSAGT